MAPSGLRVWGFPVLSSKDRYPLGFREGPLLLPAVRELCRRGRAGLGSLKQAVGVADLAPAQCRVEDELTHPELRDRLPAVWGELPFGRLQAYA